MVMPCRSSWSVQARVLKPSWGSLGFLRFRSRESEAGIDPSVLLVFRVHEGSRASGGQSVEQGTTRLLYGISGNVCV